MKRLLMFSSLLLCFGCRYKIEHKVQLNTNDNTQYNTEIIKLIDSSSKLTLDNQLMNAAMIFNEAANLQQFLIAFRDSVKGNEDCKKYQVAIDETLLAIKKIPDFADGYYKLGVLYTKANQKQQADKAFNTAKELYERKVRGSDTDRNRHLNYINLIKIDIYTENAQNSKQRIQEFSKSFGVNKDIEGLSSLTRSDLLSRTELVVN